LGNTLSKRLARDIASRERTVECMGGLAVNRLDVGGFERGAVERSPREASLRRLGTDYVDLYQIHRWDSS
jgi:aryl-alcohol dehydrogenase-like predicted oxidoreductase